MQDEIELPWRKKGQRTLCCEPTERGVNGRKKEALESKI
jgi:hypothetical protein